MSPTINTIHSNSILFETFFLCVSLWLLCASLCNCLYYTEFHGEDTEFHGDIFVILRLKYNHIRYHIFTTHNPSLNLVKKERVNYARLSGKLCPSNTPVFIKYIRIFATSNCVTNFSYECINTYRRSHQK